MVRARIRSVVMRGANSSAWWRRKAAVVVWQHRSVNDRGQSGRLLWIRVRRSNRTADLGEVIHRTPNLFEVAVDPIDGNG